MRGYQSASRHVEFHVCHQIETAGFRSCHQLLGKDLAGSGEIGEDLCVLVQRLQLGQKVPGGNLGVEKLSELFLRGEI